MLRWIIAPVCCKQSSPKITNQKNPSFPADLHCKQRLAPKASQRSTAMRPPNRPRLRQAPRQRVSSPASSTSSCSPPKPPPRYSLRSTPARRLHRATAASIFAAHWINYRILRLIPSTMHWGKTAHTQHWNETWRPCRCILYLKEKLNLLRNKTARQ